MCTAARVFAWEFLRRHRWGFLGIAGILVLAVLFRLLILPRWDIDLGDPHNFAVINVVPVAATFTYFLAVFSYGLSGDLAARESMYPARMFTLPVTTTELALWPMLYGAIAAMLLWLALRFVAVWPPELEVPVIWPGFLFAALLAWTQALTWMPYPVRGVRVVAAALWLATIDAIVMLAIHFHAGELVMVAFLAPLLPLAFLVARASLTRARRGDTPDWRLAGRRARRSLDATPFASANGAQLWFEWRRHGLALPALVALVLPFELALLFLATDAPNLVLIIPADALLTPPFLAAFAALAVGASNPPFLATRPLTSAALTAAKLKMALASTLLAWLLVLIGIPLALAVTGTWPIAEGMMRRFAMLIGRPRATVLALLVIVGLMALTWKLLVQTLYIGLTGREKLIKGVAVMMLLLLFVAPPLLRWITTNAESLTRLWHQLPLILVVLMGLKLIAAAWIVARLHRGGLLSERALVMLAASWVVLVLVLYGVLVWLADTPHIPRHLLALIAILAIPLARVSAAPLALAWSRHR